MSGCAFFDRLAIEITSNFFWGWLKPCSFCIDLLVKGYNLNVYTYTVMIQGFCDVGLLTKRWPCYQKWKTMAAFHAKTYEIIILSLFEDDDRAEKLLREMIVRGLFKHYYFIRWFSIHILLFWIWIYILSLLHNFIYGLASPNGEYTLNFFLLLYLLLSVFSQTFIDVVYLS